MTESFGGPDTGKEESALPTNAEEAAAEAAEEAAQESPELQEVPVEEPSE